MSKKDIKIFLEKLLNISEELDELSAEYSDLYLQYTGNIFENQKELSENILDNLILATTHEMASEIGFSIDRIQKLTNFIEFKKEFYRFSDEELEKIIDEKEINIKFQTSKPYQYVLRTHYQHRYAR